MSKVESSHSPIQIHIVERVLSGATSFPNSLPSCTMSLRPERPFRQRLGASAASTQEEDVGLGRVR